MDINHKYTPQTWPKHPEQATMEGKNKVVGFWIFLACEVVSSGTEDGSSEVFEQLKLHSQQHRAHRSFRRVSMQM